MKKSIMAAVLAAIPSALKIKITYQHYAKTAKINFSNSRKKPLPLKNAPDVI